MTAVEKLELAYAYEVEQVLRHFSNRKTKVWELARNGMKRFEKVMQAREALEMELGRPLSVEERTDIRLRWA